MDAYEREEEDIIRRENEGLITHKEAQKELRELRRDYLGQAQESAQRAYDEELERW
jgi:hypothetical protein